MSKTKEISADSLSELKNDIRGVLTLFVANDLQAAQERVLKVYDKAKNVGSIEHVSICTSLLNLFAYLNSKTDFSTVLSKIHEAGELADFGKSRNAYMFKEFCLAEIYCQKGEKDLAAKHFDNVKMSGIVSNDEYEMIGFVITRLKQLNSNSEYSLPPTSDPLVSLVKIGRSITAQTDINVLLKVIAEETGIALQADRCTVFLLDKDKNELWSKVALGMDSQEIRFPADKGLAGYTVRTGNSINIKDAYNDDRFNPDVDKATGYKTKTILCMPIKNNNHEIIGAFQVLNKLNGVFSKSDEELLVAIGGSASIALENAQLFEQQKELYKEQKELFESFINTLASSIDARDKITSGHSSRVKLYTMLIADELKMDSHNKEILEKAATLHDIGKIGIRDSVLQKEGKLTPEEYKHIQEHVQITHNILQNIAWNNDFKQISEIACSHHEKFDGSGYYRHLKGEEISYGGRILAVSDVFDAITSKRHYRDKMPIENVINILLEGKNAHFDANLVDVFLSIPLNKIVEVFLTENNIKLKLKDSRLLNKFNLSDIYNIIKKESKSEDDKKLISLFNYYYAGKQD